LKRYLARRYSARLVLPSTAVYPDDGNATEGGGREQLTYTVFVKGSPEAIWQAITDPAQGARYGYGGRFEAELQAGGSWRTHATDEMRRHGMPDVVVSGDVVEVDVPNRFVQTWKAHFSPELEAEPAGRVTWETSPAHPLMFPSGVTQLTLTHELEDGARQTEAIVSGAEADAGGGWALVLSDLKTLLETGSSLSGN
jgi:uncharacterized protein YndB with AHSA1/START domain